jgi:hypothetical protein
VKELRAVYTVEYRRAADSDADEWRGAVVLAETSREAEQLCQEALGAEGFCGFVARDPIEWVAGGTSRVLYYIGRVVLGRREAA